MSRLISEKEAACSPHRSTAAEKQREWISAMLFDLGKSADQEDCRQEREGSMI